MKTVMSRFISSRHFIGIALILGTPFFIVFGWLSDKLGRKYIMMGGMLLFYFTDQFTNKCLKRM
jgi:MFS family permease